jgi:hypothetical protein
MTENRPGRTRRSGLPDDDDALSALSALANQALPSAPARLAAVTAAPPAAAAAAQPREDPAPVRPAVAAPVSVAPVAQAAAAPVHPVRPAPPAQDSGADDEPAADGTEDFIKQSTVQVDAQVAQRFRRYQDKERPKPSNAEVIFRALDSAQDRYQDIIDARRPRLPEGRHFGRAVRGRRPAGTRLATQINFRPTVGEEAEIKKLSQDSGAESMSAFINAVLDEFLPGGGPRAARS